MNLVSLYKIFTQHPSIETDTRKLKSGDIFFALKGPNFNGNLFAAKAIELGAAYVVIDESQYEIPGKTILVENVLKCLQQLAAHHRQQFTIPFLAITGSNGKTTTKELTHAVLSKKFRTYTTEGNLNNHIGVPLTILKIPLNAEMAVIEMGANHPKEIESYCEIVQPTHGLITNCGKAHLEGFGSEEGVKKAKGELFTFLKQNNGCAFLMSDYDYLQKMSEGINTKINYGTKNASIEGIADINNFFLSVKINRGINPCTITTKLIGTYNLPNVLAAITIGNHFGVADEKIISAIENYTPTNSRSQLLEKGSNKFIMDAYNANPSSMQSAIENFAEMKEENKVLLLGEMAEVGEDSIGEHQSILKLIEKTAWKDVILVGEKFSNQNFHFNYFKTVQLANEWLQQKKHEHTVFLVKGSRSVQMEKIIENL